MADKATRIHSVAEAYLLLMATPCEACGKGPLQAGRHEEAALSGSAGQRLVARCQACGHEQVFLFDLSDVKEWAVQQAGGLPRVNPTAEASRAIDLGQWLMLFEAVVRAADQQTDPAESRRLGYEAAQCLEEALKFFPVEGGEWPEESAFFHEWTLDRFRRHKHLFARTRLVGLRRKLPTLSQMEERLTGAGKDAGQPDDTGAKPKKRQWWAFWR